MYTVHRGKHLKNVQMEQCGQCTGGTGILCICGTKYTVYMKLLVEFTNETMSTVCRWNNKYFVQMEECVKLRDEPV